ncbi:inhibitor of Bruton tyrosine kinase isoform X1 [Hydra vulgaris]|uniref:inhibitor of Bruton tyrosine kinase isoform X1 n=1 Tax=Hydra vulgaris TaxID=6087 RepID=UPI001F5F7A11|nr:inhibitor of Bruton tyrosine kinase isoform X1 [Hydra vulgaris]
MDCTQNCCLKRHGDYLVSAFSSEDLETLKQIIKVKCSNPFRILDSYGRSIFHIVASLGRIDVLEWLCSEQKSKNVFHIKDKESGYTALHRALYYGNIDCAILLYKKLGDWGFYDIQGNSPLDLVVLDSPRYHRKPEEKSLQQAVAILPFESEGEELSLHTGDRIEIIREYPNGWSFGKLVGSQQKGMFPTNFVEITKFEQFVPSLIETHSNVFTWGNNINFNLGQADSKNRVHPDQVQDLVDIIDVVITKFHAVFLSKAGQVFTCGHGLNGRLGHNSEETVLHPKLIEGLKNQKCINIKAGDHHTVVLDELKQVYTFGSNQYCQLGHVPQPKSCLYPKELSNKLFKNKEIIGIAAACFHTIVYTSYELYTFGLNAGQLGHSKGEKYQCSPKLVSSLLNKETRILQVLASDGASLCLMTNGDLYIMQNFICRKIATKMVDVQSLQMNGGILEFESSKIENPLQICVLYGSGMLEYWSLECKSFRTLFWAGEKSTNAKIIHIALGLNLLFVTEDGRVYQGHFQIDRKKDSSMAPVKVKANSLLSEIAEKYKEKKRHFVHMQTERIPLLFNALKCFCDSRSKSFAAVQNDPQVGLVGFPSIIDSMLSNDLEKLISQSFNEDQLHDMFIKTISCNIYCHKFILQSAGFSFDNLLTINNSSCLDFSHLSYSATINWLKELYRGNRVEKNPSESQLLQNSNDHPVDLSDDINDIYDDVINLSVADLQQFEVEENVYKKIQWQKNNKRKQSFKNIKKESQSNGKKYYCHKNFVNWQKLKNLSDVTIKCCDGVTIKCHKCILVVRSEYFQNMLSNEWLESSFVNMNIPSNILLPILNFIYTDEPWKNVPDDINYIGEVMVCADHFLLVRLKQICELSLAKKVSLKNAPELFQFACNFNSSQLKEFLAEFISLNLAYYLEARLLEDIDLEHLKELSIVYKKMVSGMKERVIKPSQLHCVIDVEDDLLQNNFIMKSNKDIHLKNIKKVGKSLTKEKCVNSNAGLETICKDQEILNNVSEQRQQVFEACPTTTTCPTLSDTSSGIKQNSLNIFQIHSSELEIKNIQKNKISPFKKKSQRERKKESLNGDTLISTVDVQKKDVFCPWSSSSLNQQLNQPVSFRDLLEEESSPKNKNVRPSIKNVQSAKFNKQLSFDEKPITATKLKNVSERSVWNDISVSETSEVSMLRLFKEEEKRQTLESFHKPVTLIQLEEKAIEELLLYYKNAYPGDEIDVKRLDHTLGVLYWNRE